MWSPDPEDIGTAEQRETEALEKAWSDLRNTRNQMIADCDFTQMPDWPGDSEAWREYRQALRDLPNHTTDPLNPEWPDKPK